MNKKKNEKPKVGGQALIEGIYMRGPDKGCIAVRKPDNSIHIETENLTQIKGRRIPILRGIIAMLDSMKTGYSCIMKSADLSMKSESDEGKLELFLKRLFGEKVTQALEIFSGILGILLSVFLFIAVPTYLSSAIDGLISLGVFRSLIEGIIKILIFIGYLYLATRNKDIRRVFEYHGAEHKSVACYEAGEILTVENVKKYSRFHPRCGTSYIFLVLIVSVLVFSFVSTNDVLLRTGLKIVSVPLVMGLSYEVLRFTGKSKGVFSKIIATPGLWVQRLTTFEPNACQIEVAIAALCQVVPDEKQIYENA